MKKWVAHGLWELGIFAVMQWKKIHTFSNFRDTSEVESWSKIIESATFFLPTDLVFPYEATGEENAKKESILVHAVWQTSEILNFLGIAEKVNLQRYARLCGGGLQNGRASFSLRMQPFVAF
jgi:hypothetical protein